ncbi:MAG: hypothetical protein ACLT8E_03965 [Akkermansia sp.]
MGNLTADPELRYPKARRHGHPPPSTATMRATTANARETTLWTSPSGTARRSSRQLLSKGRESCGRRLQLDSWEDKASDRSAPP